MLSDCSAAFQVQRRFTFVSASLLIVYEGAPAPPRSSLAARARLIDFAHTVSGQGRVDDNFRSGLSSFMKALSTLLSWISQSEL